MKKIKQDCLIQDSIWLDDDDDVYWAAEHCPLVEAEINETSLLWTSIKTVKEISEFKQLSVE